MTKPFDPRELFREASRLLKLEKEALQ